LKHALEELSESNNIFPNLLIPQLDELRAMVMELLSDKQPTKRPSAELLKRVHVMHGMHPDSCLSEQMEELCCKTEEKGVSGLVTYLEVYNSGGRQSNWMRNGIPTDELLSLIESGVASKVLACIGNSNRLMMLLEILRGPKSVAELVEKCGFGSTGQVYHHMKPLLAADIIVEEEAERRNL
jgi:DNA gyrase subunit B